MRRSLVDRALVAVVVVVVAATAVEALRPRERAEPTTSRTPAAQPALPALAGCHRVDRWLLRHGRRTSDYLKLPCGR